MKKCTVPIKTVIKSSEISQISRVTFEVTFLMYFCSLIYSRDNINAMFNLVTNLLNYNVICTNI